MAQLASFGYGAKFGERQVPAVLRLRRREGRIVLSKARIPGYQGEALWELDIAHRQFARVG